MNPNITSLPNQPEVPMEIIAQHIEAISKGMQAINAGRLKQSAVIILLQNITGLPQRDIKKVLDAQGILANVFLKPQRKK